MVLHTYEVGGVFVASAFVIGGIVIITLLFQHDWRNTNGGYAALFTALLFIVFGIKLYFTNGFKSSMVTLDKGSSTLTIMRKGMFKSKKDNYFLSQIKKVCLHDSLSRMITSGSTFANSKSAPAEKYQLVFVMQDGKELYLDNPLAVSRTSYANLPSDGDRKLGQQIALFLNVPFQDEGGQSKMS